jgi:hypothetical protein
MKLTTELVPSTCWGSNLRQLLNRTEWRICQMFVYERSNRFCEICGAQGVRTPVECHEVWEYDDDRLMQTLTGLIALCPRCHQAKHAGFAEVRGQIHLVMRQLMKVNSWTEAQASDYLEHAFEVWAYRSRSVWDLDLTWLETVGLHGRIFSSKERRVWAG